MCVVIHIVMEKEVVGVRKKKGEVRKNLHMISIVYSFFPSSFVFCGINNERAMDMKLEARVTMKLWARACVQLCNDFVTIPPNYHHCSKAYMN